MFAEKMQLRRQRREQISQMTSQQKSSESSAILQRLLSFFRGQQGCWATYAPLEDEPQILDLIDQCPQICWVFPKVLSKTSMQFYAVESRDDLRPGAKGILEPLSQQICPSNEIQGMLIPGLAYDAFGVRLGWGGGYYDRYLEKFFGLKLGVTFEAGLIKHGALPREPHDQSMNSLVSPDHWIDLNENEVSYGI